jgi:tetratricopeptide (TPR) repeat protein
MMGRPARETLRATLLTAALVAAGCGSHGKYTAEAKSQAEMRLAQIKAATEWDQAQQHFETGNLDRALRSVNNSIELSPEVPKSHLLKGRVLMEMGRADEAIAALDAGAEVAPDNAEFPYYRGVVLEGIGRPEEALECFSRAMRLDPARLQYRLAAAETLMDMSRLDEADSLLTERENDFQYSAGLRQTRGHLAQIRGDHGEAAAHFSEAAVLDPNNPALREDLARALIAVGRYSEAEATLRRLSDNPEYSSRRDILHMRARCLVELNRPVEAREVLLKLVDGSGGTDIDAWSRLAEVALILNDDRQLRNAATRMVSIAPDRPEGYLVLAMWQRRSGDLASALRTAERAMEVSGGNAAPRQLRDSIQRQLEQRGQAATP